jgi:hypothetical protein
MKRYNLSEIMKNAHRFYNSKSRMGRTFGECLKLSWTWAKDEIKFKEEREAKIKAMLANQKPATERKSFNDIKLTWSDCYNANSKGYMGSQYCGD